LDKTQLAQATFLAYWNQLYPETLPISHLFKHRLRTRWARIHSLPHAKRLSVVECFETVCGVRERRLGVIWV
jgi:hypothetical protein